VSTDYDTSDRLYFEPLTLEDVLEVVHVEKPFGIIVQFGGQTPLKLSRALADAGAPIIGTSPEAIHKAEDREYFARLVTELALKQPPNRTAIDTASALAAADEIGYPLIVRPSYVLGGRAMEIVYNHDDLKHYMDAAINVSNESPVLLDRFLADAIEVDVDAVCDGKTVVIGGIMEHIEQAGVHSGDSACSLPPFTLTKRVQQRIVEQTKSMALALGVNGLMNVQFAVKQDDIYVLEVNPRASRTVPFVSKATSRPLAKIAARVMAGTSLAAQNISGTVVPKYFCVKEAVFPFIKFPNVDTVLGPEMKSTGEVMGFGHSFGEACAKSFQAAGMSMPHSGSLLISVRDTDQPGVVDVGRYFAANGFTIYATRGTAGVLREHGVAAHMVNKVKEGRPHVVDMIKNDEITLIVNTTEGKQSLQDSYTIRREALNRKVTYFTTLAAAKAACEAHSYLSQNSVHSLQALHAQLPKAS
jgi:carbamoyl-phosphate synthase large subunit